jgi:hypothetical protein
MTLGALPPNQVAEILAASLVASDEYSVERVVAGVVFRVVFAAWWLISENARSSSLRPIRERAVPGCFVVDPPVRMRGAVSGPLTQMVDKGEGPVRDRHLIRAVCPSSAAVLSIVERRIVTPPRRWIEVTSTLAVALGLLVASTIHETSTVSVLSRRTHALAAAKPVSSSAGRPATMPA